MAECHPVGFQWVMEAKQRGAKVIHVDPRFTRTSAMADLHVPLRGGSDIAFLGGLINYVLANGREFREYVERYTNADVLVSDDFADTEDLDGLFSGWNPESGSYDTSSWAYREADPSAAAGQREQGGGESSTSGEQSHGAHGGGILEHGEPPERDPSLQDPRSSFSCSNGTTAVTRRKWCSESAGFRRMCSIDVAESVCANSGRERTRRSSTRSAGLSTRSGCSTSARHRSCSCCWATSVVPAVGSWPCEGTRASKGPPTSPRSTTFCPAICRCLIPIIAISISMSRRTRRAPGSGATPGSTRCRC